MGSTSSHLKFFSPALKAANTGGLRNGPIAPQLESGPCVIPKPLKTINHQLSPLTCRVLLLVVVRDEDRDHPVGCVCCRNPEERSERIICKRQSYLHVKRRGFVVLLVKMLPRLRHVAGQYNVSWLVECGACLTSWPSSGVPSPSATMDQKDYDE